MRRGRYKPKEENIKKLNAFLRRENKKKNGGNVQHTNPVQRGHV